MKRVRGALPARPESSPSESGGASRDPAAHRARVVIVSRRPARRRAGSVRRDGARTLFRKAEARGPWRRTSVAADSCACGALRRWSCTHARRPARRRAGSVRRDGARTLFRRRRRSAGARLGPWRRASAARDSRGCDSRAAPTPVAHARPKICASSPASAGEKVRSARRCETRRRSRAVAAPAAARADGPSP